MKIPSSYDVVGNIAILPEDTKSPNQVAKSLLKTFKHIETVAIKTKIHSGKFRLQKTKILAGKKIKSTLHKESGCSFNLNIDQAYFSPRLSGERLRISKQIKENESVLVIGSGVGVYPIIISKHSKAKEIYAIEINPKAVKFAAENIQLNKINNIELYLGDVRNILPKIRKAFDRIIMPLPSNADSFLDLALKKIKPKGIIHMYDFELLKDIPNKSIEKVKQYLKNPKILNVQKVGQSSPRNYRVCVD